MPLQDSTNTQTRSPRRGVKSLSEVKLVEQLFSFTARSCRMATCDLCGKPGVPSVLQGAFVSQLDTERGKKEQ